MVSVSIRKAFFIDLCIAAAYVVLFFSFQYILHKIGYFQASPNEHNIECWDAIWYRSIALNGYINAQGPSNTGFFILLPAIWKLLGWNALTMSFFNAFIFSLGFAMLSRFIKPTFLEKLVWLAVPGMFFMFIPYTEALFFLLVTLVLSGIEYERKWLIAPALFAISFLKPTAILLLGAVIVMIVLTNKKSVSAAAREFAIYYFLPSILGLGLFIWYQYLQTGIWFVYFQQQSQNWGHKFSIPGLPFQGNLLNGLAIFTGLVCFGSLLYFLRQRLQKQTVSENELVILSMTYILFTVLYAMFFGSKWDNGNTALLGLHRYVMVSPFFLVVLHHFFSLEYKFKHYILVVVLLNIVFFSMDSYPHFRQLKLYNINTVLVLLFMVGAKRKWSPALVILILLSFFIQAKYMQMAITGQYPE